MNRWFLLLVAVAAVAAVGWIAFGSGDGPVEPPSDPDGGRDDPERGTERPVEPPPSAAPGSEVARLLSDREREPEAVRKKLEELARTEDGVREILAAIAASKSDAERAFLYLHLVRGGTEPGLQEARDTAQGKGRAADRIPALYALVGGGAMDGELIARILGAAGDDEVRRAAIHALSLRGDSASLHHLVTYISGADSGSRRAIVYDALAGGPLTPGPEYFALLPETVAGPGVVDRERAAWRGLIDRISREDDPAAVGAAARALLRVQGPDAQQGVRDLWERTGEDTRRDLTRVILESITGDEAGSGKTLATVARGLEGEEAHEFRDQVRMKLSEMRDVGALPDLEEWMDATEDPELRQNLEETIDRIRAEAQDEPR